MSKNTITYAKNLTLISLSSLPCDTQVFSTVLNACASEGINLDMISQTARKGGSLNMSFTLSDDDLASVLSVLAQLRSDMEALRHTLTAGEQELELDDAARLERLQAIHSNMRAAATYGLGFLADLQQLSRLREKQLAEAARLYLLHSLP